jgi:hypothetical protein
MKNHMVGILVLTSLLIDAGCTTSSKDVTIVTKVIRSQVNESTGGSPDLGMSVPASGGVYWVEGQVKNGGSADIGQVTLTFRVTDGNTVSMLRAEIASIPAGKTVSYRTVTLASRAGLRFADDNPEIAVK